MNHISRDMTFATTTTDANFVFSNVYMPPKFTLIQISQQKLRSKRDSNAGDLDYPSYFRRPNNLKINFRDMAGKSLHDEVKKELLTLATSARALNRRVPRKIENFVVLPSHLIDELEDSLNGTFFFKPVYRSAGDRVALVKHPRTIIVLGWEAAKTMSAAGLGANLIGAFRKAAGTEIAPVPPHPLN